MGRNTDSPRRPVLKVEPRLSSFPGHDEIARRAYELWVSRGMGAGLDRDDWLQAERQLLNQAARQATAPRRRPP
jgi:Protein of unknown function (DUF2934)